MPYIGVSPPSAPLTSSDIADSIITEAKMADDAISLTELKAGTDGEVISWDASGNPVAIGAGTSGHFLKSQGAGSQPVFAAAGGNSPFFMATETSDQSLADYTATKANFTSEVLDSNSAFASSRFTVPAGQGGKYIIHAQCWFIGTGTNLKGAYIYIYKNGAAFAESQMDNVSQYYTFPVSVSDMLDLSATDYIEIYVKLDSTDSSSQNLDNASHHTAIFYGFKIG